MENSDVKAGIALPVMEHFATIQGEGFHSGKAAYFIRLAGCDVGCHWCDVKDSWNAEAHPTMRVDDMVKQVVNSGLRICVVTGGEPSLYNLEALTKGLKAKGISTHIETSGTNELLGSWDWITFSPKKFKAPLAQVAKQAHELKVVVYNKSDFDFAEKHQTTVSIHCELFLQPEWDKREEQMGPIVDYVKSNPRWKVSLQTHKYLNIP